MTNDITLEELMKARISEGKKKRELAQARAELALSEVKRWDEYITTFEKALELDKQQVSVAIGENRSVNIDRILMRSTWENLVDIMKANNGLLVVVDAINPLLEAKLFSDREHARNVIYTTLYGHKDEVERIRKGVYRLKRNYLATKNKAVKLNNPISFRDGVVKVLQNYKGKALGSNEIWQQMQVLGIKSKSNNPASWVDFTARQMKNIERVSPHVWRWHPVETPIDIAKRYEKELKNSNMSQVELAESLGTSQSVIANTIRLLELPEEVQQMIINQEITETHGRNLLQLKDKQIILRLADEIKKNKYTVAQLDTCIKHLLMEQQPTLLSIPMEGGDNDGMKELVHTQDRF
ncbi:MAG: hypothetical protein PHU23_13345 [Dehalococcoidales bacterium]|nr:hypothetical protein [Dehalococcoidales bacterium]